MTIDERIEFLLQSNESHNHQIGELAARMDQQAKLAATQGQTIDKILQAIAQDAANIRALAGIAQENRDRIEKLENHPR